MNKSKILLLVGAIYLFFVSFVVRPWEFASYSLIDDPFVFVETSKYLNDCIEGQGCSQLFRQVFETSSGRFRPLYWVVNLVFSQAAAESPMILHVIRYYVVGLAAVFAAALMCIIAGGGAFSAVLASTLFLVSPAFTENAARLGTPDLYLIILFSLISWTVFRDMEFRKKILMIFVLSLTAALVKETAAVIFVPLLAAIFTIEDKSNLKWYFIQPLIIGLFYFASRRVGSMFPPTTISSFPNYVSNYAFDITHLIASFNANSRMVFNLVTPVIKLDVLFIIAIFALGIWKDLFFKKHGLYWIIFAATFFAVMVPWKFVITRYHLVTVFGVYIFTGLLIEHLLGNLKKRFGFRLNFLFFASLYIIVGSNIFFRNFALNYPQTKNYLVWYKMYLAFENDQLIALNNLKNNRVYINASNHINNLEVIYGIPIILRGVYGSHFEFTQLPDDLPQLGYLLESSALTAKIKTQDLDIISEKDYTIPQIEAVAFRNVFLLRPLEALNNPPSGREIEYNWQIKKLK